MPLYRHECESCGHRFRILDLDGRTTSVTCPSCGSTKTRRLLSRVSVQFKGSGYYKTDRAPKRSGAKSRSAGQESPESKAESKGPESGNADAKSNE